MFLISLLLCFISGLITITLSNQNKIAEPLEFIGLSVALCFGLTALGNFITLMRSLFEENKKLKYKNPPQVCKK